MADIETEQAPAAAPTRIETPSLYEHVTMEAIEQAITELVANGRTREQATSEVMARLRGGDRVVIDENGATKWVRP